MHTSNSSSTPRGTPSRRGRSPQVSSPGPAQPSTSSLPPHSGNSTPSFFSCLSIPVEGAIPIEDDEDEAPLTKATSSATESKRAPRKSKTDAINALDAQTKSRTIEIDESEPMSVLAERYENAPPIPVSPVLDLSSVKTAKLERQPAPKALEPRPFGLKDCPEYHPTAEEFKDPMAYIKSIANEAKEYGICKIVPPDGWKMPFVTDTERFRFKTRVQRLNSIEASSRAKLNFLEQLYRYHKQQGNPRVVVPTINHKPLDLWLLRKEVQKQGGFEAVNNAKTWPEMVRLLGYRGAPGLAAQLKNSYARVILPYEDFCQRGKNLPTTPPRAPQKKSSTGTPSKLGRLSVSASNPPDSAPSSPLTATSSPLSEPPDEGEAKDQTNKLRRSSRQTAQDGKKVPLPTPALTPPLFNDRDQPHMEQHCEICGKMNHGEKMLLCDGCDCGFHMFCLNPPLLDVPKEQWFCYPCLSGTGGDYGFDEGEEHSLTSFQARDLEFRRLWFKTHPPTSRPDGMDVDIDPRICNKFDGITVTENDVEKEFWRLVQSPDDTVEIEYGADVHSTTHGSAMPTLETNPLNPYSKDPWNLNNIPVLSDSLLRFIKSDISGMTVPWTYVGMAFSTFCWHNEDHYTYSINFMHWGETKTWYGIPGDDAEKFEAAIRFEAPDLFEAQPDLLFQLVTLMNPKRLTDAGVRVYGCNQRAGEFVLTFPKAYHAGFNHGLNFNEAVNFALPDWLPYGRDCVQRYRAFRKLPVFSHDELLITITQQSPSIRTALWLTESLKEMMDREMENRRKARQLLFRETLEEQDRPEDQYQCTICKVFCYLSQITCPCTTKVVCVDHADLLCTRPKEQHITLRKRFSDEELSDIQLKVAERAGVPSIWKAKLHKLLMENPKPALRHLRALFAEGERIHINYNLRELYILRKCVERANVWVEAANSFTRKQPSRKRSRRSVKGRADIDDANEKPEKTLVDLYALLEDVERLGFDCPEIANLRTLGQQAERAIARAKNLLDPAAPKGDKDKYLLDCNTLIAECSSLNVLLPEVLEVEKVVDREQLLAELDSRMRETYNPTLEEVRQYLGRGRACNIPSEHEYMRRLEQSERAGSEWEGKVKAQLAKPIKTLEELDELTVPPTDTPFDPVLLERVNSIHSKGKEFEKIANTWLSLSSNGAKPRPQEVLKVAARAEKEFAIDAVVRVKRYALIADELEVRCDQVLKGLYHLRPEENLFNSIKDWKNYANSHLSLFSLSTFEKLEVQLGAHQQWLQSLPWWCNNHDAPHIKPVMDDVLSCTRPEDDRPPQDEFLTCICNSPVKPPPSGVVSDAVQCDHCFARFHGDCAKNGGSCPFCDHHHWNGDIPKERSWHFYYLPQLLVMAPEITKRYSQDWKDLETVVMKVDRLSQVIGHFLAYQSKEENQRFAYLPQVRHYMRKLYKLQFVVSPSLEVSFGLDLASLHRMLAQRPSKPKKKQRAKVTFGQDVDPVWTDGTRCICRGRSGYLMGYPPVLCEGCQRQYHCACVFFPSDAVADVRRAYQCPLCCLRKNKPYRYADVRVQPPSFEARRSDIFVNWSEMFETSSKDILYMSLPQPTRETLYVELVRYTAASGGTTPSATSTPASNDRYHSNGNRTMVNVPAASPPNVYDNSGHSPLPPPPWSRWTAGTPDMPATHHRRYEEPPRKKKRFSEDEHPPMASLLHEPLTHRPSLPPASSIDQQPPPSQHTPSHSNQTLSPSLARLMSPVDVQPRGNSHDRHHSPSSRSGVDIQSSPPMRGLGDSPKLMRNKIDVPSLPPIRDAFDTSPRIRNGPEVNGYRNGTAVELFGPNGHPIRRQ